MGEHSAAGSIPYVEDGEVEGEAEADGVGRLEPVGVILLGHLGRLVVLFDGVLGGLAVVPLLLGDLGDVPVVVAGHLQVKDLGLDGRGLAVAVGGRFADELVLQQREHVAADRRELVLDLAHVLRADFLLHDVSAVPLLAHREGGEDAPRRTLRADHVLVRDGEEVAHLHRERALLFHNQLHELDHLLVPLRLLGGLRKGGGGGGGGRRGGEPKTPSPPFL